MYNVETDREFNFVINKEFFGDKSLNFLLLYVTM